MALLRSTGRLLGGEGLSSHIHSLRSRLFSTNSHDFPIPPTLETLKPNPKYQDLTHRERQILQEIEARKYKGLNLQNKARVEAEREAKSLLKGCEIEVGSKDPEEVLAADDLRRNLYDEVASRVRSLVRGERLSGAVAGRPPAGEDPISAHVKRRAQRISAMLRTHIEQLLTCNDPEFIYHHLGSINISINYVRMRTSKSQILCYYDILSDHPPGEVQTRLDGIAPKMRFWIARKLELGYTPPIKFIINDKKRLARVKQEGHESAFNMPLLSTQQINQFFHRITASSTR